MPLLLNCRAVGKAFGSRPLFENVSLTVEDGDRLGMIGPNGAGKSTLLKILAGALDADSGEVVLRKGVQLAYVPQQPEFPAGLTAEEVVRQSLATVDDDGHPEAAIAAALGKTGFPHGNQRVETLSGGWRKRLAIARELVRQPDILLLDEPTNHLDLDAIVWLEKLLATSAFASIVVSHDRYLLEDFATRMAELSPAYPEGIFRVDGNYSRFLEKKQEYLAAQAKQQDALESRLRREVEWLRRGPKARTTKSKARIDEAHRMMDDLAGMQARAPRGTAAIDFTASQRQTKRLIETKALGLTLGGRRLFGNLSLRLGPGMRLGLAGANGSGKTSLLRLLNREITPTEGIVEQADQLQVVYFDQHRDQLDPTVTLRRALAPEGDTVQFRGRPIHVAGWAARFLFRKEQLDMAVEKLSGGEKARVLIARLMLRPADVLLLDEPTNDLDIPTLEVLEESLVDFPGALVLVTHDRYLLDAVSTHVLALDGDGNAEFFADYSQWERARQERSREKSHESAKAQATPAPQRNTPARKRLSYMEQREYDCIEQRIHEAEAVLEECKARMQAPDVVTNGQALQDAFAALEQAQAKVDALYARWSELEDKAAVDVIPQE
ncbi:MAG: ABC-F family ATP-binding cassette domain-containing protein [Bryobacteraceae bacterium]|nr:ABC-F family ATP-binding cassette domain-containing protein [Bryobacteraceae bacterium]